MEISKAVFGFGSPDPDALLDDKDVFDILNGVFTANDLTGQRVLIIIPDSTRTMPFPLFFKSFYKLLHEKVKKMDFIIALGTHQPMSEDAICSEAGITLDEMKNKYKDITFYNHEWDKPETFMDLGSFDADEIDRLTYGTIHKDITVQINKLIMNYDLLIVCGPVFPHEVIGYSGGAKYFFPGISGPEFINTTHWIGAMSTCIETIGVRDTPQRDLLERAAKWIPVPSLFCCPVVKTEGIYGLFSGDPYETWKKAADLSSQVHIKYETRQYNKVVSVMPHLYDDIWTAAKGMYKLEAVVADGGELIIYAPHISEISYTHGKIIDRIGYHCRDYFVKQWDKFKDEPWGVLAHSTHLTGLGIFEKDIEKKRIKVSLATAIPKERCEKVNLGYIDPETIDQESYKNREEEGILYVPHAGETLYKIKS
ncbi:MAG: lactate racemase domain-containing protein [Flexilinea sp.]